MIFLRCVSCMASDKKYKIRFKSVLSVVMLVDASGKLKLGPHSWHALSWCCILPLASAMNPLLAAPMWPLFFGLHVCGFCGLSLLWSYPPFFFSSVSVTFAFLFYGFSQFNLWDRITSFKRRRANANTYWIHCGAEVRGQLSVKFMWQPASYL